MKKIILCFLLASLVLPLAVLADSDDHLPEPAEIEGTVVIPDTDVLATVDSLTNWFFTIVLIVAVWFFIWAGFNFVTANGDTEKIGKARSQVLYGVIGVLVAALAKGIVSLASGLAKSAV